MSRERLSKLQKWILLKCLKNIFCKRHEAREFYGVNTNRPATATIEVCISRSFKNLMNKQLINRMGFFHLTEKGFLKAKKFTADTHLLALRYEDYKAKIDQRQKDIVAWRQGLREMVELAGLKKKRISR